MVRLRHCDHHSTFHYCRLKLLRFLWVGNRDYILKDTKTTKLNDFLPLNAVLKQFVCFAVPYSSIRFSITIIKLFFLKVNLSVVRKNLFNSKHCSKIKKMHDYAVLDIELTLFSEKALLFSNAAATQGFFLFPEENNLNSCRSFSTN